MMFDGEKNVRDFPAITTICAGAPREMTTGVIMCEAQD
jgi:hypothetical protein